MKTAMMSAMGGFYEFVCQKLLQAGMEYLEHHPEFQFTNAFEELQGQVEGLRPVTEQAKNLHLILIGIPEANVKQIHTVLHHLSFIHTQGYEFWLEAIGGRNPSRLFDFDGTLESCPKPVDADMSHAIGEKDAILAAGKELH